MRKKKAPKIIYKDTGIYAQDDNHIVRISKKERKKIEANLAKEVARLHKKYGAESIVPVVGKRGVKVDTFSTLMPELNDLLTGESDDDNNTIAGSGTGMPKGRIIEIYGPESSGKTTLTLHLIAAAQRQGGVCAFIDAEHALDTAYAAKLHVKLRRLLLSQPDSGEQAGDILKDMVKSGVYTLIVVDSVAALVPQAEFLSKKSDGERRTGETVMGGQARLMSQLLRRLTRLCAKSGTTVIFTNQIRMKIGVMWGNPETTPGGNALKFYASIRLDVRKVKTLKKGTSVTGHRARIKCVKNKVAPPFRELYGDIKPNRGIVQLYADPHFGKKGATDD